jgi:hypothetical protein
MREEEKRKEREEQKKEEKQHIIDALNQGKMPYFAPKCMILLFFMLCTSFTFKIIYHNLSNSCNIYRQHERKV